MAEDLGGGRVGALLDACVFCRRAVRRVYPGELPVNDPLERNKRNVTAFYDLAFNQCKPAEAMEKYAGDNTMF